MKDEFSTFPRKVGELSPGEAYYALVDEAHRMDDGTSDNYIDIIYLGNKEQALGWLMREEDLRNRPHYHHKSFRVVIMKPCVINRTVTIDL